MHAMPCPLCTNSKYDWDPCPLCNGTKVHTWTDQEEKQIMKDINAIDRGDREQWRFGAIAVPI